MCLSLYLSFSFSWETSSIEKRMEEITIKFGTNNSMGFYVGKPIGGT